MIDISGLIISLVANGALLWLTRTWLSERLKHSIKHEYDLALETVRAKLKAEAEVELVRLRSDLAIAAVQRQVRYAKVFERQVEVIAEVYSGLLSFVNVVSSFADSPGKQTQEQLTESYSSFVKLCSSRRLYLPKKTANGLDAVMVKCRTAVRRVQLHERQKVAEVTPDWNAIAKAWDILNDEIPQLLIRLEDDFREALGTQEAAAPAPPSAPPSGSTPTK